MSVERVEDQRPVAVVAGGTGHVGEGIVRVLLREGMHVVVPSRDAARLEQLKRLLSEEPTDRLVLAPMDAGERRGAHALPSPV